MKAFAMLIPMLCVAHTSLAAFYNGNDLAEWNQAREVTKQHRPGGSDFLSTGMMRGYVTGVHDTYEGTVICAPPEATIGQMEDIVGRFVENHPEIRTQTATDLVLTALSAAFPCKK